MKKYKLAKSTYEDGVIVCGNNYFSCTYMTNDERQYCWKKVDGDYELRDFDLKQFYDICVEDDCMNYYEAFMKVYRNDIVDDIINE